MRHAITITKAYRDHEGVETFRVFCRCGWLVFTPKLFGVERLLKAHLK